MNETTRFHTRRAGRPHHDWYLHRRRQSSRAESFIAELEAKARHLAEWPRSYPARDDTSPGLRAAVHGRYLRLYRDLEDEVRVVRIVHGARDLPRILDA